jgi:hypothetical protein
VTELAKAATDARLSPADRRLLSNVATQLLAAMPAHNKVDDAVDVVGQLVRESVKQALAPIRELTDWVGRQETAGGEQSLVAEPIIVHRQS